MSEVIHTAVLLADILEHCYNGPSMASDVIIAHLNLNDMQVIPPKTSFTSVMGSINSFMEYCVAREYVVPLIKTPFEMEEYLEGDFLNIRFEASGKIASTEAQALAQLFVTRGML